MEIKKILKIFKENSLRLSSLYVLVIFFNIIGALMEGAAYCFVIMAFSSLTGGNAASFFLKIPFFENQSFLFLVLFGISSQVLKSAFCFLAAFINAHVGMHVQHTLQSKIYEKILKFSFACANRYKVGELAAYIQSPVNFVRPFLENFNLFVSSLCLIGVSLIILFSLSFTLTLFTLGLFAVALFFQKFIVKKNKSLAQMLCTHLEQLNVQAIQSLEGLRVIHLYNQQKRMLNKIGFIFKKFAGCNRKLAVIQASTIAINETIGICVVTLCMVVGYWSFTKEKELLLPLLLGFMTVTYRLAGKVQGAMNNLNQMTGVAGFLRQIVEVLKDEDKEFSKCGTENFSTLNKEIIFKNISFTYPSTTRKIIENFSYKISKGNVIALVGESGAGKSSLLDLLSGLYLPSSGTILIDGQDLKKYDLKSWRERIGVVSQDSYIFNDTIENNIRLGKLHASSEEVMLAAKNAKAHEFIDRLPAGYKTSVGEKGYRLSGGERQRLAMARALIRDPEIIILDEATSNLDVESEKFIQESLEKFKGIKTLIIVAHRLSTIKNADQIVVLHQGEIAEVGSHEELLSREGRYSQFWNIQFREKEFLTV